MEPVPGVVWHEIETIKKRYYGNSRVEPEGSMEAKPEYMFLYVHLRFFVGQDYFFETEHIVQRHLFLNFCLAWQTQSHEIFTS